MMRTSFAIATLAAAAMLPALANPAGPVAGALQNRPPAERAALVWWRAGGTTAWGNHWHAGGTGGYGAWHGGYARGYAHGWAGADAYHGYYAHPVPVTPWYHPAATAAVVAGAAAAGAATGAYVAGAAPKPPDQPTTVINNYYD